MSKNGDFLIKRNSRQISRPVQEIVGGRVTRIYYSFFGFLSVRNQSFSLLSYRQFRIQISLGFLKAHFLFQSPFILVQNLRNKFEKKYFIFFAAELGFCLDFFIPSVVSFSFSSSFFDLVSFSPFFGFPFIFSVSWISELAVVLSSFISPLATLPSGFSSSSDVILSLFEGRERHCFAFSYFGFVFSVIWVQKPVFSFFARCIYQWIKGAFSAFRLAFFSGALIFW